MPLTPRQRPVTLALTGDVMLGRLVNGVIAERGFAHPWGNVLPLLREADLTLINLECALTACKEQWHDGDYKAFYFRAEPEVVETLRLAEVDLVNLANNHACDFGTTGLIETGRLLDEAGIAHVGAGANLEAARRPAHLEAGGLRVAVIGAADHPLVWAASESDPGINYVPVSTAPDDLEVVIRAIEAARSDADLVIYCTHWGPNMRPRPTPAFQEFAHRIVDAGADIFWGHSAHVVQGVEVYRDRLILYDTGDFVDDYIVDPQLRNDRSALFLVEATPGRLRALHLVPVQIADEQVNIARGESRDWFASRFADLSAELGTVVEDDGERLHVAIATGGER